MKIFINVFLTSLILCVSVKADPSMKIHYDLKGKYVCIKEVAKWNICKFDMLTYNGVDYESKNICFLNSILAPGDDLMFLQPLAAFAGTFYDVGCLKLLANNEVSELNTVAVEEDTSRFNLLFSISIQHGDISASFDFNPGVKGFGETICGSFTDADFMNPDYQLNVCVGGQYLISTTDFKSVYNGQSIGFGMSIGPMSINAMWAFPLKDNWNQPVITACFDLLGANMFSVIKKAIGAHKNINKVIEFKKKLKSLYEVEKLKTSSTCYSTWISESMAKTKYPNISKVLLGISGFMNKINKEITGKNSRFKSIEKLNNKMLMAGHNPNQ
jgi:hypothetical protein